MCIRDRYLSVVKEGLLWSIGKQPNLFKNQPCKPLISDLVTMYLQSLFVILLPAAIVNIKASHLDLWVGASTTEPLKGKFSPPITILLRKKLFNAKSCVANIANRLQKGSTPRHIFFSLWRRGKKSLFNKPCYEVNSASFNINGRTGQLLQRLNLILLLMLSLIHIWRCRRRG